MSITSMLRRTGRAFVAPSLFVLLSSLVGCAVDAPASESDDNVEQPAEATGTTSSALVLPSYPNGSVFATIPTPPGHPEGILVLGDDVFVSGPAVNGTAGFPASQILIFDRVTGASKGAITVAGETIAAEHALSCITSDASGRLYVLSTQLGVLRFTKSGSTWTQSTYAPPLPDLPNCGLFTPAPCSPTLFPAAALPNDLAFDAAGNLYITDSYQATIFKVAPGGGTPTIWFQSSAFEGIPTQIGLNGIRINPAGTRVYVTVTLPLLTPLTGTLYSIPLVAAPKQSDLRLEHLFGVLDGPDGIAFDANGDLLVALASLNGILKLNPSFFFTEKARYYGPTGSAIAFDGPANIAFDGNGSILVTNHAPLTNNAAHFAVIKADINAYAAPLFTPSVP